MVKFRIVKKDYLITDAPVYLSITIGEGQMGSSAVLLDNNLLKIGEVNRLFIGNGPDLVGKELRVKTLVSDTNDQTNRIHLRYSLMGGVNDWEGDIAETVEEEGDSLIVRLSVRLLPAEEG